MEAIAASAAEVMLSALFDFVVHRLSSSEYLNFGRKEKSLMELKKWEQLIPKITACLDAAEEKQMTSGPVMQWLRELREIAYDAEDIIDEIATESLRRKILGKGQVSSSKVPKFFPSCFTGLNPGGCEFSSQMGSRVKRITAKFEEIIEQKKMLNLVETEGGRRVKKTMERLQSTSLVESQVYGREKDKDVILELLVEDEIGEVGVLSIVGMAGVGKTTLAQLVYNDAKVENFFDMKIWVCVSEEFDVVSVTRSLLQAVTLECCDLKDLNSLQVRLKEKLSEKKFLIVLDDVWNENYDRWDVLRRPLMAGAPGSKILVTTQMERVASMMKTLEVYRLQALSDDACFLLFSKHALGSSNFDRHVNLKGLGEEIVKKCKGLPLAAKTLGGLLRGKVDYSEWEDILRSKIWEIPEERGGILPALRLSYHYLPSHLKRCFSYCAIFPKDYEFDKNELALLWMAEGLIQPVKGGKPMWDVGLSYFHELLSRSFFQQSKSKSTLFVMHDLINDLARSVSGELCFHFEGIFDDELLASREKLRHLSFTRHRYDISKRFGALDLMKSLRTFLALPIITSSSAACCFMSSSLLQELLENLRCLRVLCLSGYAINKLPHSIDQLLHLRYLNLAYSAIEELPDSVGSLLNLQTFLLRGCKELTKLPQGIENLINLLVLDLSDTDRLVEVPLRMSNLKKLQILSKFIVGKDDQFSIRELKNLLHLKGHLSIMALENVQDIQDARDANMKEKPGIDSLDLKWSELADYGNECGKHVLDLLQPSKNLKELRISFYGGKSFPSWLGDPFYANIVHVSLNNCNKSDSLPSLGRLPSLKVVDIRGMDEVRSVGFEFYGDGLLSTKLFPSLEVLLFQQMVEWKSWSSPHRANGVIDDVFPSLRELTIQDCPKLIRNLPSCLPSLVKLTVSHCPKLEGSVMSLPLLRELNVEDCNKGWLGNIVDLSSLTSLRIRSIRDLDYLPQGMIKSPGALQTLNVSNCSELNFLWQKSTEFVNMVSLEHLKVKDCIKFVSLIEIEEGLSCVDLEKLSLKTLEIESCPNLVASREAGLWSPVRNLRFRNCAALKTLPDCLLEDLEIEDCPSITCFPRGNLPKNLQRLKIRRCPDLLSLPEGIMQNESSTDTSVLERLDISDCSSLTCFPNGILPLSLKTLKIANCSKLESFSDRLLHNNASLECIDVRKYTALKTLPECLYSLMHLTELMISHCSAFISFPSIGLPPTLRSLEIYDCVNLRSLPERMEKLVSLQTLIISDCPRLMSLPDGGLPPKLIALEIWDCANLKGPFSEWELHSLSSLKDLCIVGAPYITSFPDENCLELPTTLTSIFISRLDNLESLSKGLQNLNSLEELVVAECPKLRHLPREGLPESLGRICIRNCQLLKQQCLKEKGPYQRVLARIPCIEIEDL